MVDSDLHNCDQISGEYQIQRLSMESRLNCQEGNCTYDQEITSPNTTLTG